MATLSYTHIIGLILLGVGLFGLGTLWGRFLVTPSQNPIPSQDTPPRTPEPVEAPSGIRPRPVLPVPSKGRLYKLRKLHGKQSLAVIEEVDARPNQ